MDGMSHFGRELPSGTPSQDFKPVRFWMTLFLMLSTEILIAELAALIDRPPGTASEDGVLGVGAFTAGTLFP